ncbi:MAG TPA: flagellar hook-associated protein FlgK [Planctomycetota bacterium]|nr:flagellar hook-associated protein FlgK [Planctomycetota bacterium]
MSSLALNTGLKALLAAQSRLETIGHNVSNASTPGYSRQTLEVGTSGSMRIRGLIQGTGVEAQVVRRTVDQLLQTRLTNQGSVVARLEARVSGMSEAEGLLSTGTGSLDQLFKSFFGSLSSLSTTPEDKQAQANTLQFASDIGSKFKSLSDGTTNIGIDAIERIQNRVVEVNQLAERISRLNAQIMGSESGSGTANDMRDAREQAVNDLSALTDVRTVEDGRGALRVLVGGQTLVSPVGFEQLEVVTDGLTQVSVQIKDSGIDAAITGGEIGGLLGVVRDFLPGLKGDVDQLAHNFILEMNRVHSTGMPSSGPMRALLGANALVDQDSDGQVSDELLANAGLGFDVNSGEVFVNVTDQASGVMQKHRIAIDAGHTTVQDLLNSLSAIAHLSASVDGQGHVQIQADQGFGFDFSARLDVAPDDIGSFGGGRASLASATSEPFTLAVGNTLDFTGPLGNFSVALQSPQFQDMSQATAAEIAAALNSDANFQANGLVAHDVGGALVMQTAGSGTSQTFTLRGGSANGALGLTANTAVQGQTLGVAPAISGAYTGAANDSWTFRPSGDGTIGTTAGLKLNVFDKQGVQIAQLDIGANYQPGTELEVANGVKVAFGLGNVSASNSDLFQLDVIADSDTSDLLPALGLGTLFTGSDASSIDVRSDLVDSPELFASSSTGAAGDAGNVVRLLELAQQGIAGLGNASFDSSLIGLGANVATELSSARDAAESEDFLRQSLEARRDQTSGVNVDEELARMIEAQQAYDAAGQYMRVVSELSATLFNIL